MGCVRDVLHPLTFNLVSLIVLRFGDINID